MAAADGAPGFPALVQDIVSYVAGENVQALSTEMNAHNADWDAMYPFSAVSCLYAMPRRLY